jgi:hypothetical protein
MEIKLTDQELDDVLMAMFANGGLIEMYHTGLQVDHEDGAYERAKQRLLDAGKTNLCREDVYIEILKGGDSFRFFDHNDGEHVSFNMEQVKKNLSSSEASNEVMTVLNEQDDGWTGWNLLQLCLYGEIIFG